MIRENAKLIFLTGKRAAPKEKGLSRAPVRWCRRLALLLAQYGHRDGGGDVGVQRDLDREIADLLERALRHAHVGALDLVALCLQRLDDVVVRDRAEATAVRPRLLRDLPGQAFELCATLLRLLQCPRPALL